MKEEAKRWLDKAEDDLKKGKDNLKIKNYDLASFLCQQAVEKSFKAFLIEKTGKFPKIHDLVKLGKIIKIDNDLLTKCEILNPVYIETRYPDIKTGRYTVKESDKDIKDAEIILKWIKKNIL